MTPFRSSLALLLLLAGPALGQGSLEDDLRDARQQLQPAATAAPEVVDKLVRTAAERLRDGQTDAAVATLDKAAGVAHRSGATGRSFELSLTAAEALRQAQQHSEAARRFRHAALQNPRDPRAAEAHRAACDALVPLLAAASDDFLAAYDKLLAEHLDTWPDAPSTSALRRRRLNVLALSENWSGLLTNLKAEEQAEPDLLVEAHAGLLNESPTVERFEAAQADLHPLFLVGDPPDWTKRWTPAARRAALALATAALGRAEDWNDYAQRLLRVATTAPPTPDAPWRREAAAVRAAAALANGDPGDADTALEDGGLASAKLRAELIKSTTRRLAEDQDPAGTRREAARLAESLASLTSPAASASAAAMADAGRHAEALAIARALAEENPDDRSAQAAYAGLLADSADAADKQTGLDLWRQIEERDPRGTDPWYEARLARIDLLAALGQTDDARKLAALTQLLAAPPAGSDAARRLEAVGR